MKNSNKIEVVGIFEVLGAFFLAGSSVVACKIISETVSVYIIAFLSMLVALIILIPLQFKRLKKLKHINRKELLLMLLQALSGIVLTRILTLYGIRFLSAFNTGMINSMTPGVMALLSFIILKERFGKSDFLGLLLTISGIVIINCLLFKDLDYSSSLIGIILITGSVFCESLMTIFRKMADSKVDSLTNTTILFFISFLIFLPLFLRDIESVSITTLKIKDWLLILYYGVFGSVIAYILWGRGVVKVSAAIVGSGIAMIPISIIFLSAILLNEKFSRFHLIGVGTSILGIVICSFRRN